MDLKFMEIALLKAKKSGGDIPVGAVIVQRDKVLAIEHNLKEKLNDASAHAEIAVLRKAGEKLGNWRMNGCDIYITLEPCPMCAWALINSGIENIYFGAYDQNYGALGSKINLINFSTRKSKVYGGIMEKECKRVLDNYFAKIHIINKSLMPQ